MLAGEYVDNLFHALHRIDLPWVCSKRRNTYPLLETLFLRELFLGQQTEIALGREHRPELQMDGIAKFCQHVGIVLERGGLLNQSFVFL